MLGWLSPTATNTEQHLCFIAPLNSYPKFILSFASGHPICAISHIKLFVAHIESLEIIDGILSANCIMRPSWSSHFKRFRPLYKTSAFRQLSMSHH